MSYMGQNENVGHSIPLDIAYQNEVYHLITRTN